MLLCFISTSFWQCQKEEFETISLHNKNPLNISVDHGDHVFKESPLLRAKVTSLKKKNTAARLTSSLYNFSIDEDHVQVIVGDDYTQFTFNVERDNPIPNLLENYVCKIYTDGEVFQYLMGYPYSIGPNGISYQMQNSTIQVISDENIIFSTAGRGFPPGCVPEFISESSQYVCTDYRCTGDDRHLPGEDCPCNPDSGPIRCNRAYTDCGWVTVTVYGCGGGGSSGDGDGGDGGFGAPAGGGSTTPGTTTPTDPVVTVPFENKIEIKFIETLDFDEYDCYLNNTIQNPGFRDNLISYLNLNSTNNVISNEVLAFAKLASEATCDGGEVDFGLEIILDSTFSNDVRLKCIWDKINSGNNTINSYLNNFKPEFSVAHLRFKNDVSFASNYSSELWGAGAVTIPPNNYIIDIVMNSDPALPSSTQNFPSIIIALEIIHETIHAEIFRKLMSVAGLPNVNFNNLTQAQWENYLINLMNSFPGLYDYFVRFEYQTSNPTGAQHELMAQHYIEVMVNALKDFDNNAHTDSFYQSLAWMGLKGTVAWNNLSESQRNAIDQIIQNAIQNENYNCTN